jgi:hypothetical protein
MERTLVEDKAESVFIVLEEQMNCLAPSHLNAQIVVSPIQLVAPRASIINKSKKYLQLRLSNG